MPLSNRIFRSSGSFRWEKWQKMPKKSSRMAQSNFIRNIGKKLIFTGLIIFGIGAFLGNFGGDIAFQFGIAKLVKKRKFAQSKNRKNVQIVEKMKTSGKIPMCWTHGLHRGFGPLRQWAGHKKRKLRKNSIPQI